MAEETKEEWRTDSAHTRCKARRKKMKNKDLRGGKDRRRVMKTKEKKQRKEM